MKVNILSVQKLLEKENEGTLETEDIIVYVDNITKNIQSYTNENELYILKKLKQICVRNAMHKETVKMIRNIGMYYFYKSDTKKAFGYLNKSIKIVKEQGLNNLLVNFLSDKGLILFYELKYKQSKIVYLQAFKALTNADNLEKRTIHLLHYRAGILYCYMGNYADSGIMLNGALQYAELATDKGWTLVNIGVNYERQGRFNDALKYFQKALALYGEDYTIERSSVYNSIAETYKNVGEHEKALENISKAFELLECKNMGKFFVFFQTYTEIKILQGKSKAELEKLIELISQVKDFFQYKCFMVEGINVAVKASMEDKKNLSRLDSEISGILDEIGHKNITYRKELDSFMSDICLSLKVLSSK